MLITWCCVASPLERAREASGCSRSHAFSPVREARLRTRRSASMQRVTKQQRQARRRRWSWNIVCWSPRQTTKGLGLSESICSSSLTQGTGKGACPHIGRSLRVATRSNPLVARSTALRRCLRCSPSYSDLKFAPFLLLRMFHHRNRWWACAKAKTARTSNRYNLGYTANTVAKIAALYSARLGDSNELGLAAIGRYGDTPPYRYLNAIYCVRHICALCVSLSVTISAFFGIDFWPAWFSPRMRLSSPDHSPLIARTRVLAICSFCRF